MGGPGGVYLVVGELMIVALPIAFTIIDAGLLIALYFLWVRK
jgi:hypothetical protein